jgi:biotin carboxyl carrier protein
MNAAIIEALVRRLEGTSIAECEYEFDGTTVALKFDRQALPQPPSTERLESTPLADKQAAFVCAARIGLFHAVHPLELQPLVAVGDAVKKDQQVAFIMIGELMFPVLAPADGLLGEQLAAPGTLVGYGDKLFSFETVVA